MNNILIIKASVISVIGAIGAYISTLFGGWSGAMTTLVIFMLSDYFTGWLTALYCKSKKTESGGLSSKVGFIGLMKKFAILIVMLVGCRLDIMLETNYIKDAIVITFCSNELLSIAENVGLMGIKIPLLNKVVDILNTKSESEETK